MFCWAKCLEARKNTKRAVNDLPKWKTLFYRKIIFEYKVFAFFFLKEHQQRSILREEEHQIIVRRAKLLPTAFNAIKSPKFNCCKNLVVTFSGEAGQDTGGQRREFFR